MLLAEGAAPVLVATIDKGAAPSALDSFDLDMLARIDLCTAPGAVGELMGRAATEKFLLRNDFTASSASSVRLGVLFMPTQRPMRNGSLPRWPDPHGGSLAGADERGGTLELLQRQQAQRVAHEHGDAGMARIAAHCPLQTADGHGVGGHAQIGFGLAAAGREPEQIGQLAAIFVVRSVRPTRLRSMNASWNVRQEWLCGTGIDASGPTPRPGVRLGVDGMDALIGHGPVGKTKRRGRRGV